MAARFEPDLDRFGQDGAPARQMVIGIVHLRFYLLTNLAFLGGESAPNLARPQQYPRRPLYFFSHEPDAFKALILLFNCYNFFLNVIIFCII